MGGKPWYFGKNAGEDAPDPRGGNTVVVAEDGANRFLTMGPGNHGMWMWVN